MVSQRCRFPSHFDSYFCLRNLTNIRAIAEGGYYEDRITPIVFRYVLLLRQRPVKNERRDREAGGGQKDNDIRHDFPQLMVKTFESVDIEIDISAFLHSRPEWTAPLIAATQAPLSFPSIIWRRLTTNYDTQSK